MEYSERGSHARSVCRTQGNSRLRTARVKQGEESDKNITKRVRYLGERNVGANEEKKSQTWSNYM